ncbi:MAG: hypothetical protein ACKVVP_24305 [Chloroflexota bacterium]
MRITPESISRLSVCLLLVVAFGCSSAPPRPTSAPSQGAASATEPAKPANATNAQQSAPSAVQPASSQPLVSMMARPERGIIGTPFTVAADGLPPEREVEIQWATWTGRYATKASTETVEYLERTFVDRRVSLGTVRSDPSGRISYDTTTPEDFGEVHDIFAVIDGRDVARGGFRVLMDAQMSPKDGPIGTPVTLRVTGMAAKLFSGSTLAVRYDNAYTGIMTATTTAGTAEATLRASGPLGAHIVQISAGSVPSYLNIHQSPFDFVYSHLPNKEDFQFSFNVTEDTGPTAASIVWPNASDIPTASSDTVRTTSRGIPPTASANANFEPQAGPVGSLATLRMTGLQPNSPAQLFWTTARGNRVTPSGWSLADVPLAESRTDAQGGASTAFSVPDDLGGWHVVRVMQNDTVVIEAPYFVERSIAAVTPTRLRTGENVTIQIKGVGWTELDNGFAVTYDNAYVGYACGFNSNGDVTMQIPATGGRGTHLIDLYPMVYKGKEQKAWYWTPVLTFERDFPALSLGYRIPAMRLSIEIVD